MDYPRFALWIQTDDFVVIFSSVFSTQIPTAELGNHDPSSVDSTIQRPTALIRENRMQDDDCTEQEDRMKGLSTTKKPASMPRA